MKIVNFGWRLEMLDDKGEISVHSYAPSLTQARETYKRYLRLMRTGMKIEIALVRRVMIGDHEVMRQYAYYRDNGELPSEFYKGKKVPARFRRIKLDDIIGA